MGVVILKIFLAISSVIIIIVTIIYFLNLRRYLNNSKMVSREQLLKKTKPLDAILTITIGISIIGVSYNIYKSVSIIRHNDNISNYETYIEEYKKNDDVHTKLKSFPAKINKENVIDFSEYNRDGLFDGSYFIYLKYQYDEDSFNSEFDRIKEISIKTLKEKDSKYITYIISDDEMGTKEYVLIDKDKLIIVYNFIQLFELSELNINY